MAQPTSSRSRQRFTISLLLGGAAAIVLALVWLRGDPSPQGGFLATGLEERGEPPLGASHRDLGSEGIREPLQTKPHSPRALEGALDITTRFASGEPAPRIFLSIEAVAAGGVLAECTTDAEGRAKVEGVTPGLVSVLTLRRAFEERSVEVVAGTSVAVEVVVPDGNTVHGRVVDAFGRGVAGCGIEWVVDGTGRERGVPCGRSDPDGRFMVQAVPAGAYLGARKAGYETSLYARAPESGVELVLRLAGEGGALIGRVSDAAGIVVAGAVVAVGRGSRPFVNRMSPGYGRSLKELLVQGRTRGSGEFALEGIPLGVHTVRVEAAGRGSWAGSVEIRRGESHSIEICLLAAGRVQVLVRDRLGAAFDGARIHVVESASQRRSEGSSDSQGRWLSDALLPGSLEITVDDGFQERSRTIELSSGALGEVVFEVAGDASIRGRVVDPSGSSPADLEIRAEPSPSLASFSRRTATRQVERAVRSDEEGSFAFRGLPRDVVMRLSVWDDGFRIGMVDGVSPGSNGVAIPVDRKAHGWGKIRGSLHRPDRRSASAINLTLIAVDDSSRMPIPVQSDGSFEKRARQGTYELVASGPGLAVTRLGVFKIPPVRTLDVGRRVLDVGGKLAIRSTGPARDAVRLYVIRDENGRRVGDVLPRGDDSAESCSLPAGEYAVQVLGEAAAEPARVTVHADRVTEVVLEPTLAHEVCLFHTGSHQRVAPRDVTVTIARGAAPRTRIAARSGPGGEWSFPVTLVPGEYTVSWSTEGEEAASARVRVAADVRAVEVK